MTRSTPRYSRFSSRILSPSVKLTLISQISGSSPSFRREISAAFLMVSISSSETRSCSSKKISIVLYFCPFLRRAPLSERLSG